MTPPPKPKRCGAKKMFQAFVFFDREASPDCPAGTTVSKRLELPKGDFMITEYIWGSTSLWFVDADHFTADERQEAYLTWPNRKKGKS